MREGRSCAHARRAWPLGASGAKSGRMRVNVSQQISTSRESLYDLFFVNYSVTRTAAVLFSRKNWCGRGYIPFGSLPIGLVSQWILILCASVLPPSASKRPRFDSQLTKQTISLPHWDGHDRRTWQRMSGDLGRRLAEQCWRNPIGYGSEQGSLVTVAEVKQLLDRGADVNGTSSVRGRGCDEEDRMDGR